jgi:hypothetical protein
MPKHIEILRIFDKSTQTHRFSRLRRDRKAWLRLVIMETKRRLFEPGDMVSTFTGQAGMVISEEIYSHIRKHLKEGRRPGHYFAPGCCQNPDYVIQVPVLFEDATWDVMRAMNIKRTPKLPDGKKSHIQRIIDEQG